MQREKREFIEHPRAPAGKHWKKWIWAIAPEDTQRVMNLREREPNQEGFMNSKMKDRLRGRSRDKKVSWLCGIYEWGIKGNNKAKPRVVYVGSTCARNGGRCTRMQNRILSYCKHGNHKSDLINKALREGYELWVRFMPTENERSARDEENRLLENYDYAWNKRNNGKIRNIL